MTHEFVVEILEKHMLPCEVYVLVTSSPYDLKSLTDFPKRFIVIAGEVLETWNLRKMKITKILKCSIDYYPIFNYFTRNITLKTFLMRLREKKTNHFCEKLTTYLLLTEILTRICSF